MKPTKRELFSGGGALLVLYAILSNRMLSLDLPGADTGIGLRGVTACVGGTCHTVDEHTTMGTVSFVVALLCVAALGAAVYFDRVRDDDRLWRPIGSVVLLWLFTVVAWYFTMPSSAFITMGSGVYATLVGVSLVSAACFRLTSEFGGNERARLREQDIEAKLAAFSQAGPEPSGAAAPTGETTPKAESAMAEKPASVPLRFVASQLAIADDGVRATYADGREQRCRFEEIGQVVARQLPEELGRGSVTLLDLIPAQTPGQPIRILPETSVNYAFLPQGLQSENCENVRAFVNLVRALNTEVRMDEGSQRFVDGAATPLPFQSVEHFWKYDSRYTA